MKLPLDIERKLSALFPIHDERQTARGLISSVWNASLAVGPEQVARSLLVICHGDLNKLSALIQRATIDARDVIMEAEAIAGYPGHYFIHPFAD